jgi:hypothetical protein
MKLRFTAIACILLFAIALPAFAQMDMPKPAPELKKLDFYSGVWNSEGELKPGPMGPGGKFTSVDRNEWMQGGFFLVTHSTFKSAMGDGVETAYMGYNPDEKVYTYDAFTSTGEADHSKGTVEGDTWTWNSEQLMGGKMMKGRFTMKLLSPTSYTMKYEISDGTNWTTVMEGKGTKQ